MKKIYYFLLILFFAISCSKEECISNNKDIELPDTEYNNIVTNLALAVNHAMKESESFRAELKMEALKMFDGDYDILLSNFVKKKIPPVNWDITKGELNNEYTIGDLLNNSLNCVNKTNTKVNIYNGGISEIINKYPKIQFSIPVNIEKWNESNILPIAVIPDNYVENETKYVPGYDNLGNKILIDAMNEPLNPYLVIGLNERMGAPIVRFITLKAIPRPENLYANITEVGIQLLWSMPSFEGVVGYDIYRLSSNSNVFIKIGEINNVNNMAYNDLSVEPHKKYSYYIIAKGSGYSLSAPSNTITVTSSAYPEAVSSFDVMVEGKNSVELRWKNNNKQYVGETRLYKRLNGSGKGYDLFKVFKNNESDYFDDQVKTGDKITYRISHATSFGESSFIYDVVQIPYRDVSKPSPVFIKQIKIGSKKDLRNLESWLYGKPEFYLTVTNFNKLAMSPYIVADQMVFKYNKRELKSQEFNNRKVLDWSPGFWYDMLSFHLVEYDDLGNFASGFKTKATVGYNDKNEDKTDIDGDMSVSFEIKFDNDAKNCGNAWLSYYDNPEQWLTFQNYNVKVLVSEQP